MPVKLSSLSLEQQIGQFLCIGLPGRELDATTRALVEEVQPGGIIIFGRNVESPEQLRRLIDGVREMLPVEPIISIDQEGGLVDRLRRIFTPMPPPRVIRQHGDLAAARELGRITGTVLRLLGFNMNFAPVMSIMTDERDLLSNGLYSRSFGRSPGEVLGYAMVYLRGLQSAGCMGCLKHFPGIGAGEVDSHEEIPIVNLSEDDLMSQDLAPYIELFVRADEKVHAVMVSHGGFPQIDIAQNIAGGRIEPASMSRNISTRLLREELGFDHLVVTDDLEMGAIIKHYTIDQASVRAFNAGQDMLLICAREDRIRAGYGALLEAARSGVISEQRQIESLRRIEGFKLLVQAPLPFDRERFDELNTETLRLSKKLNYSYGGPPK